MKEYSKVIYGKKYTLRKGIVYELFVDDVWVKSSNSVDNIRGELFELLLNMLYEVSIGANDLDKILIIKDDDVKDVKESK